RVPLLVAAPEVATTVCDPTVSVDEMQLQVPAALTVAVQSVAPALVTVTTWPGTPVPVMDGVVLVVFALPPAGGLLSVTAAATHACVAELQNGVSPEHCALLVHCTTRVPVLDAAPEVAVMACEPGVS